MNKTQFTMNPKTQTLRKWSIAIFLFIAFVVCIGQSHAQTKGHKGKPNDVARDEAAIRTLLTDVYAAKVNANEAAPYAKELYADDVLWAPPDAPDRTDRAGIQAGIQSSFDKFTFAVQPSVEEIKVYGEFAYAIGVVNLKLTPKAGGEIVPLRFRIFWLLARQDNEEWRISRQIWNKKPV